jgi:hypothetical protein
VGVSKGLNCNVVSSNLLLDSYKMVITIILINKISPFSIFFLF